jgi:hypothetical protein
MSFNSEYTITCDGCGLTLTGNYTSKNIKRRQAEHDGWLTAYTYDDTTTDYCRDCTEEYARLHLDYVAEGKKKDADS